VVLALDVDRGVPGHLREILGRVPITDAEGLQDADVGEEGEPRLAVGALELRKILHDQPERDAEPAGEPDVALNWMHATEVREFVE
jgi:hypothetical protein